ncbi:MAG: TrkH family potassium uptake protein [Candidatus Thermoplasmatota archaeon]|nr:TrkH family potassium uptake protein [Candidatus Thermoplasmatota archaeon]
MKITLRLKGVSGAIGLILLLFSLTFILPIVVAVWYSENIVTTITSYLVPMIITANIGLILWFVGNKGEIKDKKIFLAIGLGWVVMMAFPVAMIIPIGTQMFYVIAGCILTIILITIFTILRFFERNRSLELRDREAFVTVGVGWILMAFLGSLPYVFSGTLGYVDGFFETMSGFATCGSTVLTVPNGMDYLDVYSHSIMFWRALTQWLGGMGIIVLSVVVLTRVMGAGGAKLFRAEAAGHRVTRLKPRLRETASILWKIYLLFTVVQIILLATAGMGVYDAVCHSFTSIATGGFSTHYSNVGHYNNPVIETIITAFMIIGGTSFILHYRALTGKPMELLRDPEFRFYMFTIITGILLVTLTLIMNNVYSVIDSLRYGIFNTVSINTASGFSSTDFGLWPAPAKIVLVLLMFAGGCVGSTAGGIKIIRTLILLKAGKREIQKFARPRAVMPITIGGRALSEDVVKNVAAFFFLYLLTFVVATILLSFTGLDAVTSSTAVATTMGTVGPGFGGVGPAHTFAFISPLGKILLSLCMWIGRLEIFACLILFLPGTYKS